MSAPPTIPPRPARAEKSPAPAPQAHMDVPKIPPRPKRGTERSVSPAGDRYARSPLNDPTFLHTGPPPREGGRLTADIPSRPPSVSMPSLGEEGNEYASFEDLSKTLTNETTAGPAGSPQQLKSVAGDLPLHAPTASVPSSTAKSRIQAVTRTDSSSAEAAGFGKQLSVDERVVQSTTKTGRSGSSIGSRPSSLYNDKDAHGIPEIGVQVPMFRGAGDVQAPSPAPHAQQSSSGVGFHQKAGGRHHRRTKSGREIFHGPPGSYGLHGHGVISKDEFEQKWYERHPEDLKREKAGEYGPHIQENRKDYHWRADNLEKLVHTKGQDIGMGTSREAVSTPDEQIGYMATEQFTSRMASPRPQSSGRPGSIKASHADSLLRNEAGQEVNEQGEVIHIDPPAHRSSKIHGGGYDPPTEHLGPQGGNTSEKGGWVTEHGYGTPILASDEVKKHPDTEWRQPAVSPEMERHGSEYTVNEDGTPAYITKVRSPSRSSSRNNNNPQRVVPNPAQFDRGGTPLESHKEYEPLFPEDEEDAKKPKSQVDKLKRPSVARHHFPSQDVWEDTPGSLQLQTTVETPEPQVVDDPESATGVEGVNPAKVFENPSTEEERKTRITKEDQQSFLPDHTRRFAAENKQLGKFRDENPSRPSMQQRFPSQDIWEDSPSYGHLETTVTTPQTEDTNEYAEDSPVADKPTVPVRPSIPTRPAKKDVISPIDKKAPIIPERPKPQLPARPSKPTTSSSENVPTIDSQAESDAPQMKAKPPVPARPASSKIAALQAGFLSDLNSKLGLGPQAPKIKEPESEKEEEAAPLQDARKGRAKGPQRRKPAASPVSATTTGTAEAVVPTQKLSMGTVTVIWSFGEDGALDVSAARMAAKIHNALRTPAQAKITQESPQADNAEEVAGKDQQSEAENAGLVKTTSQHSESAAAVESVIEQTSSAIDQTSSTLAPVVSNVSETVSPVVSKASDAVQKTMQPAVTQASEALEPVISEVSSALQPGEPLITETTSGSVDAPGAFPGSGPGLEDKIDAQTPGVERKEQKSTLNELSNVSAEAKKDAHVAESKESATSTQSHAA